MRVFILIIVLFILYSVSVMAVDVKISEVDAGGQLRVYYSSGASACVGQGTCTTVAVIDRVGGGTSFISCDKNIGTSACSPACTYAQATCSGGYLVWIRYGTPMSSIYYDDGNTACSAKGKSPCSSIRYGTTTGVTSSDSTGCGKYFGSNYITATCGLCTGSVPAYAQLCTGDDTGLTADTAITLVTACGTPKCEYTCNSGYYKSGTSCVATSCASPTPSWTGVLTNTGSPSQVNKAWVYSDVSPYSACSWRCDSSNNFERDGTLNSCKCKSGYSLSGNSCVVACTPAYVNSCDNTDGCGNTRSTSPYNSCDLTSNIACGTESICRDSIDNNCNGESDYDSMDGRHGDSNCAVGVTGISAPANAYVNNVITVGCTSSVANVNSISATLGGNPCGDYSWSGNTVYLNCNTGSSAGTKTVTCYVDTAKSYKSGSDQSKTVNVQNVPCAAYTISSTCPTATCDWCAQCSNPFSTGQADACVSKGTCPARSCHKGQCGAACDGTLGGCSNGYACDANCACIQTCKTYGSCSSNSETCSGYWCSSNNVCQNKWHWSNGGCVASSQCGNYCPWTPLQSEYWTHLSDCINPNKEACCKVTYGTETTDWCKINEL